MHRLRGIGHDAHCYPVFGKLGQHFECVRIGTLTFARLPVVDLHDCLDVDLGAVDTHRNQGVVDHGIEARRDQGGAAVFPGSGQPGDERIHQSLNRCPLDFVALSMQILKNEAQTLVLEFFPG